MQAKCAHRVKDLCCPQREIQPDLKTRRRDETRHRKCENCPEVHEKAGTVTSVTTSVTKP